MSDRDCENCKHHTEKGCDSWDCNFEKRTTRKEAIKGLKDILEEATRTDYSVCYVTSADADIIKTAINSLEIDERYELEYEQAEQKTDILDKIRAEIEELDRYYDNDYFSTNNCPMYKCNEVLLIIDKYKAESEG